MDKRTWIVFGVAVILILGVLIVYSRQGVVDVSKVDNNITISQTKSQEIGSLMPDNVYGNKDAKTRVIEYGDYSCPGCKQLADNLQKVLPEYQDRIAFIFREFPITQIHPNSRLASSYALAASYQGKYWEMHDILYKNREAWWQVSMSERDGMLDNYAKQIGLNMDQLKNDIKRKEVAKKIDFDLSLGKKSGVTGTPTVFINGKIVDIEKLNTPDQIKKAFDEAIKQQ